MKSIEELLELAEAGKLLHALEIKWIMQQAIEVFQKEQNVKHVSSGVTVVGDIHGQFYDLLELFRVGGKIPFTNYLFLGDYVDRGHHSIETIVYLTLLKIKYPSKLTLIRGNHESRAQTTTYGFYTECLKKFGSPNVWQYVTEMFDYLPIAAVIDNKLFCVHGGLSPLIHNVNDVNLIQRFGDIPTEGAFADLVWSDPDQNAEGFCLSMRGAGYVFGEAAVDKFLFTNNFTSILRAHQLCQEGYSILFDGKIVTVWSAPNYFYRFYNLASILEIDENLNWFFNIFEDAERKVTKVEERSDGFGLSVEQNRYFE